MIYCDQAADSATSDYDAPAELVLMMHKSKGLVYIRGHNKTKDEYTWSFFKTSEAMPAEPVSSFRPSTPAEVQLRKEEARTDAAAVALQDSHSPAAGKRGRRRSRDAIQQGTHNAIRPTMQKLGPQLTPVTTTRLIMTSNLHILYALGQCL